MARAFLKTAPMTSLEAPSGPQQPQAAAQQLGRRRSLLEGVSRGVIIRGLATLTQQAARREPKSPAEFEAERREVNHQLHELDSAQLGEWEFVCARMYTGPVRARRRARASHAPHRRHATWLHRHTAAARRCT